MKPTNNKYRPPHTNHGDRRDAVQAYMDEIGEIPVLSRAEEIELIKQARQGNKQATDKLIRSNLRFVVQVANEYQDRGLSPSDLIGEGNMGLLRALQTFDPNKGFKFITYAVWWIRQHILHAIGTVSRTVRLPGNRLNEMRCFLNAEKHLAQKLHRRPAVKEVEAVLVKNGNKSVMTSEYLQHEYSLDAPLDHDSAKRLISILPNEQTAAPDDGFEHDSLRTELADAFNLLGDREKLIIELLFGLQGKRALKLAEAGDLFGLSRERVRQIRNQALDKLRRSRRVRSSLQEYL